MFILKAQKNLAEEAEVAEAAVLVDAILQKPNQMIIKNVTMKLIMLLMMLLMLLNV
jgi:hypothetical protein